MRFPNPKMIGTPVNSIPCRTWGSGPTSYLLDRTLNVGLGLTYMAKFAVNRRPDARIIPARTLPTRVLPQNTRGNPYSFYAGMVRGYPRG